jgi:hypothetical protein
LLLNALDSDKAHIGTAHRFADRLSVIGIVLITFHVGFYELGCDQLHRKAALLQQPRPVVRAAARFHADLAVKFNFVEQALQPFCSAKFLAPYDFLKAINPMNLKDILGQIDADADNLHGGLLLSNWLCANSSLGTTVPVGEEESIPLLLADSSLSRPANIEPERTVGDWSARLIYESDVEKSATAADAGRMSGDKIRAASTG